MGAQRRTAIAVLVISLGLLATALAARWRPLAISGSGLGLLAGFGASGVIAALVSWWSPDACDLAPRALRRRYQREFLPPLLGYVVVMLVWSDLLDAVAAAWLRVSIALLPVAMFLLVLRAIVRYVRDSDELQRRIELESIAVGTGFVCIASMTAGFLQSAGLIQVPAKLSLILVFPGVCFVYGIARSVIARRYL